MSGTTPTIPQWTREQFYDDMEPFVWLYEHRGNKFVFQRLLAQVQVMARQVGVVGFSKMWNAFVAMQDSTAVDATIRDTEFPDQPIQLHAGKYRCDENGVSYTGYLGEEVQVISHPILPIKRIVNMDSGEEKIQLAFTRGARGAWRKLIVPKRVLASAQKIVELADSGVAINSENAKEVVKFLGDIESENYDQIATQYASGHMGWMPEGQFVPYCDDIVYDGDNAEGQERFRDIRPNGDEAKWMELARQVRNGDSVPARMVLAASFAAPVIKLMGGLNFFCHIWGTQGCGKTVGMMLAASVWGDPEVGKYIKSFGGTKVSQELNAAFYSNLPVIMDELQVAKERKVFDDIIYMLCEGASKGRGAKSGGLQTMRRWCTCMITSGEMPIVTPTSGGGAAVRTIEINYGGKPLFTDLVEAADTLKNNFGFAGPKFIEALRDPSVVNTLRSVKKSYADKLNKSIEGKQVESAAILLAADKLADVLIFKDGKALSIGDVEPYLLTKEAADVNGRCYQWLLGTIGANPARFRLEDNNGELWGVKDDAGIAYIIRPIFDRLLQNEGFSTGAFLTWAKRAGKIRTEHPDRMTIRRRINGQQIMCIGIVPTEEVENKADEVRPEEMPF